MLALALWLASSPRPSIADAFTTDYDALYQQETAHWLPGGPDWKWLKAQGIQESGLNPNAESPVGAQGVAQFMPGTWSDVERALGWRNVSRKSAYHSIVAQHYYMSRLMKTWARGRTTMQQLDLAFPSYNAGTGSVLKAQAACGDAKLWRAIAPCLPKVTGAINAAQTTNYGPFIARWRNLLGQPFWPCTWDGHRGGCGPVRGIE